MRKRSIRSKTSRLLSAAVVVAATVSFIGFGPTSLHAEEGSEDYSSEQVVHIDGNDPTSYEAQDVSENSNGFEDAEESSDFTDEVEDGIILSETDQSSEIPVPGYEYCDVGALDLEGYSSLYALVNSEVALNTDYYANVGPKVRGKLSLSTTQAGVQFYSQRFGEIIDANCLLIDNSFEGWEHEVSAIIPDVGQAPNDLHNWVFAYYPNKDSELTTCTTECPSGIANLGTWVSLEGLQSGFYILLRPK